MERAEYTPDEILEAAKDWDCKRVLVIGEDDEGEPLLFSSVHDLMKIHELLYKVQELIVKGHYVV